MTEYTVRCATLSHAGIKYRKGELIDIADEKLGARLAKQGVLIERPQPRRDASTTDEEEQHDE